MQRIQQPSTPPTCYESSPYLVRKTIGVAHEAIALTTITLSIPLITSYNFFCYLFSSKENYPKRSITLASTIAFFNSSLVARIYLSVSKCFNNAFHETFSKACEKYSRGKLRERPLGADIQDGTESDPLKLQSHKQPGLPSQPPPNNLSSDEDSDLEEEPGHFPPKTFTKTKQTSSSKPPVTSSLSISRPATPPTTQPKTSPPHSFQINARPTPSDDESESDEETQAHTFQSKIRSKLTKQKKVSTVPESIPSASQPISTHSEALNALRGKPLELLSTREDREKSLKELIPVLNELQKVQTKGLFAQKVKEFTALLNKINSKNQCDERLQLEHELSEFCRRWRFLFDKECYGSSKLSKKFKKTLQFFLNDWSLNAAISSSFLLSTISPKELHLREELKKLTNTKSINAKPSPNLEELLDIAQKYFDQSSDDIPSLEKIKDLFKELNIPTAELKKKYDQLLEKPRKPKNRKDKEALTQQQLGEKIKGWVIDKILDLLPSVLRTREIFDELQKSSNDATKQKDSLDQIDRSLGIKSNQPITEKIFHQRKKQFDEWMEKHFKKEHTFTRYKEALFDSLDTFSEFCRGDLEKSFPKKENVSSSDEFIIIPGTDSLEDQLQKTTEELFIFLPLFRVGMHPDFLLLFTLWLMQQKGLKSWVTQKAKMIESIKDQLKASNKNNPNKEGVVNSLEVTHQKLKKMQELFELGESMMQSYSDDDISKIAAHFLDEFSYDLNIYRVKMTLLLFLPNHQANAFVQILLNNYETLKIITDIDLSKLQSELKKSERKLFQQFQHRLRKALLDAESIEILGNRIRDFYINEVRRICPEKQDFKEAQKKIRQAIPKNEVVPLTLKIARILIDKQQFVEDIFDLISFLAEKTNSNDLNILIDAIFYKQKNVASIRNPIELGLPKSFERYQLDTVIKKGRHLVMLPVKTV